MTEPLYRVYKTLEPLAQAAGATPGRTDMANAESAMATVKTMLYDALQQGRDGLGDDEQADGHPNVGMGFPQMDANQCSELLNQLAHKVLSTSASVYFQGRSECPFQIIVFRLLSLPFSSPSYSVWWVHRLFIHEKMNLCLGGACPLLFGPSL